MTHHVHYCAVGKERLFLEVARTMGKKVYVSKEKMQILQCCSLPPEYGSLLTTDHLETNIHAVSVDGLRDLYTGSLYGGCLIWIQIALSILQELRLCAMMNPSNVNPGRCSPSAVTIL